MRVEGSPSVEIQSPKPVIQRAAAPQAPKASEEAAESGGERAREASAAASGKGQQLDVEA